MWLIIGLVIIGVILLVAELVLLPGLSVAGICALLSYIGAAYLAFNSYGTMGGFIVIGVILVLSVVASIISLKANTWQRFSLKNRIDGVSQHAPKHEDVSIGDHAETVTRLAPMGKVVVNGKTYEAKSTDQYIDPQTEVEVIGFENFNIIVKQITKA